MDDRAGTSAEDARGLRIGFVPGVTLTKWRRVWAERYPRTPLEVVEVAEREQRRVLDDGAVDLCFARLPLTTDGLHVIRLYEEVPVVLVPRDHPVTAYPEVVRADVDDEEAIEREDGEEVADLVAGGAGVAFLPMSVARSHSRRDLAYRPVADAEPTTIALCWRRDVEDTLFDDFIGVVRGRTVNSSRTVQAGGTAPRAKTTRTPRAPRTTRRQKRRR
ncbi:hypothetical protein DT076_14460 [Desertihabitans brevis]|uniref:LysR substrate-binding domain-containing protein n=1 Tax=Desertihabitans brevis TaxID=2268447 RepID=A0A367YUY8_9ACTN|nr:LysR family substrate-binding domain-containing protein [Desertihabitans brevis]RCK68781.1 hypothetical protein DT076_14460 [Desertihabitans brevis]